MKIAVLGAGDIFYRIITALDKKHQVLAVATNKGSVIDGDKLQHLRNKPTQYSDYKIIILECKEVELFLMCSYAPLIEKQYFKTHLFINIHYALLPKYRGFHGFTWSMINGEHKMGYSVFKINEVIDGGPVYFQYEFEVKEEDDIFYAKNEIENHLEKEIPNYIYLIEQGKKPIEQNEVNAIYVTKRKPEDGEINWNWQSKLIYNHVRALVPPFTLGAYTYYKGKKIVIMEAKCKETENYFATCGKIVNITNYGSIYVKCGDGIIEITKIFADNKEVKPQEIFRKVGTLLGK